MTAQNTQTLWTIAHEKFALKHKLCPAARLLWHWLLLEGKLGKESEPDLKEFNNWVKSQRGKQFTRPWLKHAFNQLVESRVIAVLKTYTWNLVKIVTRPLEWLKPPRLKQYSRKRTSTNVSPTSNPQNSERGGYNSSNCFDNPDKRQILTELANLGIFLDPEAPCEIFTHTIEDVRAAIRYMESRRGRTVIENPVGWLINCLRWRYWDQPTILDRLTHWFRHMS